MFRVQRRTSWAGLLTCVVIAGCLVPSGRLDAGPLADAAEQADWKRVGTLLKQGAAANDAQADGSTALHWAAQHEDLNTVRALLAAGAQAGVTNHYGVTSLHLACVNGHEEIVRALLKAGADANHALRGGETALMTAARTGRTGPITALIESGAKVEAVDRKGQTALMWAAAEGHAAAVDLLIKAGANPKARLKSGFTPMLFAAREGKTDAVRSFLRAGIDANESIETERKANSRAPGNGTSALMLAVENGHFELAAELLKAGADPNDQRSGFTPLHAITWVRKPNRGDDDSGQPPPRGSGRLTSLDFVRQLVKAGAKVNAQIEKGSSGKGKLSTTGATPFLMAAKTADVPLMKVLVELGADPFLPNKEGATPLMAAAGIGCLAPTEEAGTESECVEAVTYLISLGADLNTVDQNGETAMHGAAYKSLPKMVQLLARKGLSPSLWNQKNRHGWTPLLIAEGYRPGNFKPSAETIVALHQVMREKGLTIPPPTPRLEDKTKGYNDGR